VIRTHPGFLAAAVVALAVLASCGGTVSDSYVIEDDPGHVEFAEGSEVGTVMITEEAAGRLRIETAVVRRGGEGLIVPSDALIVDPNGQWWVYTTSDSLTFVRTPVEVVEDDSGQALLSAGPKPNTEVATVGVAELYGIEVEVGH
jgi:hypothetical protein